jgi:hypothetical protein
MISCQRCVNFVLNSKLYELSLGLDFKGPKVRNLRLIRVKTRFRVREALLLLCGK